TAVTDLAGNNLAANKVWTFTTGVALPPNPDMVNLGESGRFALLAYAGITNDPAPKSTVSNGDIGITPTARTAITGFTTSGSQGNYVELTNGRSYAPGDLNPDPFPYPVHYSTSPIGSQWTSTGDMLTTALQNASTAYTTIEGLTLPAPAVIPGSDPTELGGKTLYRGIYVSAVPVKIEQGDLTLDGQGDSNSVWIFQLGNTLTTGAPGGNVILTNGAQAKNVFWQVAGAGTAGVTLASVADTHFYGNVLSWKQINVSDHVIITGRLFSITARITLISDNITGVSYP
ncbi:MAG: ice-binding family protein, partial [Dehalococcoidia bacterium]|nr:ice-binding family protein [Dehalococcoidia bacterium]